MRIRPNQTQTIDPPPKIPNSIYRKFKKIWQKLLSPQSLAISHSEFDKYYVIMPEIHKELFDSISTSEDSIVCLLGYTGIGKSTIIRRVFEMNSDRSYVRKVELGADSDDGFETVEHLLYIPLFMNPRILTFEQKTNNELFRCVEEFFSCQLSAACTELLTYNKATKHNEIELAKFISQQSNDLLEVDVALSPDTDLVTRMNSLMKLNRFAYEIMRLKWLLSKSQVDRVVLILDDVEALTEACQSAICHVVAQSYYSLKTYVGMKKWKVNGIISIRPVTWNEISKTTWYRAFGFAAPIGIKRPADLAEIFKARFKDALIAARQEADEQEIKNWEEAHEIFEAIYRRLSKERSNFLVKLCNYNVRAALLEFQSILLNREYFDPRMNPAEAPRIGPHNFDYRESTILKILCMGNGRVYPNIGTVITNIFLNTEAVESDLLGLLMILAILHTGEEVKYGLTLMEKNKLFKTLLWVCALKNNQNPDKHLSLALLELKNKGLVRTFSRMVSNTSEEEEVVELMPRAEAIWAGIKNTSVLTEMFRDDSYAEYSAPDPEDFVICSQLADDVLRIHAARKFAKEMAIIERNLVAESVRVHNDPSSWLATFGKAWPRPDGSVCIGRALLIGLERSMKAIENADGPVSEFRVQDDLNLVVSNTESYLRLKRMTP